LTKALQPQARAPLSLLRLMILPHFTTILPA
jgi:hypothetical protein